MPLVTYAPPTIQISSTGAKSPVLLGLGKTVLALGTAPQGPDYPMLTTAGQLATLWGDPTQYNSVGYTLPYGLNFMAQQRQPVSNSAIQFLVCRVGVTRASYVVKDASLGTCFTLYGIGAYAGGGTSPNSRGNALTASIAVTGGQVSSITINDSSQTGNPAIYTLSNANYDLSSNAKIVAAINGTNPLDNINSVVQATVGTSTLVPAVVSAAPFTGGADGKGALASDATITTLLSQSLAYPADYIWAGWDLASIASTLTTHVNSAQGLNQFRKVVGGPAYGTAFSSLSGSYTSPFAGGRFVCLGADGLIGTHPATGLTYTWDGYMGAAALLGLKAVGPTEETCDGMALAGFSSLGLPTGKTAQLSDSDLTTLGAAGCATIQQRVGDGSIRVRDYISSAPFVLNGAVNPWSQFSVQDIDDAVSNALVTYLTPYRGRPRLAQDASNNLLQGAATSAMASLGTAINGVNSITVYTDPSTLVPTVSVSYTTRYPLMQVVITTSFTYL